MKRITLHNSDEVALVDTEDHYFLMRFNWCLQKSGANSYATALVAGMKIAMHRLIMNPAAYEVVDHKDQNGLNNQKKNLRIVAHGQNTANRKKFRGQGKYLGVIKKIMASGEASYIAMTYRGGSGQYHGTFTNEVDAAKARDEAAKKIWGSHAALNFPEKDGAK